MRSVLFALAAVVVTGLSACQSEPVRVATDPTLIQASLNDCQSDRIDVGISRLDSLLGVSPGDADVLATRGLCRWARFSQDSVQADVRAAFQDLTASIDAVTVAPDAFQTPLDRLYNQRAFVVQAMQPGEWNRVLADLDRAVELAPDNGVYVLDRGVARALSGDTAQARADLARFNGLATAEERQRGNSLRALLDAPRPAAASSVPADQAPADSAGR